MAFTYLILNVIFMACIVALLVKNVKKPSKNWAMTLIALLLLTLVFDNLAIWAGIFTYAPDKILGVHVGFAPIEDFFYAIFAVILIPVLWERFKNVGASRSNHADN